MSQRSDEQNSTSEYKKWNVEAIINSSNENVNLKMTWPRHLRHIHRVLLASGETVPSEGEKG